MSAVAARTGQELNYDNLARDAEIDNKTAKSWFSYLQTSGLIFLLQPYSNNPATRAIKTPKMYFTDRAKEQLEFLIETKVNTESQAYLGYETLKRFTEDLVYEVACICEADSAGIRKIDSKTMIDLSGTIGFSLDEREEKSKLGFMA